MLDVFYANYSIYIFMHRGDRSDLLSAVRVSYSMTGVRFCFDTNNIWLLFSLLPSFFSSLYFFVLNLWVILESLTGTFLRAGCRKGKSSNQFCWRLVGGKVHEFYCWSKPVNFWRFNSRASSVSLFPFLHNLIVNFECIWCGLSQLWLIASDVFFYFMPIFP